MAIFKPRVLFQHQLQKRRKKKKRPGALKKPDLSLEQILAWADSHHERTGEWPIATSGNIVDAPGEETWAAVNAALRSGYRGLPGGSSLVQLLAKERGKRNPSALPHLHTDVILAWADAHHKRTGTWPTCFSGPVAEAPGESWSRIDFCLNHGQRGLPGGTTLARLLAKRRGARNRTSLPALSQIQILGWAKDHHEKTGTWPTRDAGSILAAPLENWLSVDASLRSGGRGLPGNSSLARFLEDMLGVRNIMALPRLNSKMVLAWADAHFERTGHWPMSDSGSIIGAPNERWGGIDTALSKGTRGLGHGGSSLARFLQKHRGVRNSGNLPPLTMQKILRWADLHHGRTGAWPMEKSGPIAEAPGESWNAVEAALRGGKRGLPGGSSLAQVLETARGKRNLANLPPITEEMILEWADTYRERTGKWPSYVSGPVAAGRTERWNTVNDCLRVGGRGLPGGSSLALLLAARRGARNRTSLPMFRIPQILKWAKDHFKKTGKWPTPRSGAILGAPAETWSAVANASRSGMRGLPGNSSLAEILDDHLDERKKTRRQETRLAKKNQLNAEKGPPNLNAGTAEEPG